MSDPHGIIDPYRKGGSMIKEVTISHFDQVINTIYQDNFGHVDFMDNMGGDCDCNIHNVLNFLHEYEVN